jgi:hypothetical protein
VPRSAPARPAASTVARPSTSRQRCTPVAFMMPFPVRGGPLTALAALAAVTLLVAAAQADPPDPPPPAPPTAPPAAAPPPAAPAVKHPSVARPPKAPEEVLPEPELRARIVAPSARGLWTLHLENEGAHPLRVPADVRLLHLTVESGDTVGKRQPKPVKCALPAGLRPEGFPERNAVLLAPGDSYVEAFDPRLFCFGKDAKAIVGGALVRAHYGWEPAKGAKKTGPFVAESTAFPAVVEPKTHVVAPPLVLSWLAPVEEEMAEAPPSAAPPEEGDDKDPLPEAPEAPAEGKGSPPPPTNGAAATVDGKPAPVDENAPRLELTTNPYAEAVNGFKVSITVTLTNVGHRPALAAVRSRMVSFRVEGPDGVLHCHAARPSFAMQRQGYVTLKPGGSTALTLLVTEACGSDLFRRPGLYRIKPTLHLDENGADLGLSALTGSIHAVEPTVVRVAEGPEPFYKKRPHPTRAIPSPVEPAIPGPPPPESEEQRGH